MQDTNIIIRNTTNLHFDLKTQNQVLKIKKYTKLLLLKFFSLWYGKTSILRLYGIGFSTQIQQKTLLLKIGFSVPVILQIPKSLKAYVRKDERKRPNIIWFFSNNLAITNSFIKIVQKYKPLSIFVRKRITGILQLNELSLFKFKKWKDKKKKRK